MNLHYEGDRNLIAVEDIEKALLEYFGKNEIDDRGCNKNGRWFSLESVMEAIKERA